jgi:hypothetical protein
MRSDRVSRRLADGGCKGRPRAGREVARSDCGGDRLRFRERFQHRVSEEVWLSTREIRSSSGLAPLPTHQLPGSFPCAAAACGRKHRLAQPRRGLVEVAGLRHEGAFARSPRPVAAINSGQPASDIIRACRRRPAEFRAMKSHNLEVMDTISTRNFLCDTYKDILPHPCIFAFGRIKLRNNTHVVIL